MAGTALGLIEAVGLATAAAALDMALDTADVEFVGYEKVIGAGKSISVTIQLVGEVAAVEAAVASGREAGERIGTVLSTHVIPRPHEEVQKLVDSFKLKKAQTKAQKPAKKPTEEPQKESK